MAMNMTQGTAALVNQPDLWATEADRREALVDMQLHGHALIERNVDGKLIRVAPPRSHRPPMCRNYPYGGSCEHGCDCSAAGPLALLEMATS